MTSSRLSVNPEPSARTVALCGILSLGLHVALLAGLQTIQQSEPLRETVPLVKVTLVPTEVSSEMPQPNEKGNDAVAPLMRTSARFSTSSPILPPTPPTFSQPQPLMAAAALELTPTLPTVEPVAILRKKRILQDTAAADALFAQQAIKMVKRTSVTETLPSSASRMPDLQIANIPRTQSLPTPGQSINAASATTQPIRRRRLTAEPPTKAGTGIAKIAVRHSVRPVYPRVAKEAGWEGTVILRILVTSNGLPNTIAIQKSSGHAVLDKAAIEAMQQWRFTPAMDGNFAVEKYVDVPLRFGLHH